MNFDYALTRRTPRRDGPRRRRAHPVGDVDAGRHGQLQVGDEDRHHQRGERAATLTAATKTVTTAR
jgi:hypothetical protein